MNHTQKSSEEHAMAEKLWLYYFNNYLYANGIITRKEYTSMIDKIIRYSDAHLKK